MVPDMTGSVVQENLDFLGANPDSEEWSRYLDLIDNIISLKFKASVDSSYQFLIENTG